MTITHCIHLPQEGNYKSEENSNEYIRTNFDMDEFIRKATANYETTINSLYKNLASFSGHFSVISSTAVTLSTFCAISPSLKRASKTSILLTLTLTIATLFASRSKVEIPKEAELEGINVCTPCIHLHNFIFYKNSNEDKKADLRLLTSISLLVSTLFLQASQYFSSKKCKVIARVAGGAAAAIGATAYGASYSISNKRITEDFNSRLQLEANKIFS